MSKWKIFVHCHNVIWDDMYRNDPDFSDEHYHFLKLGRHELDYSPAKGYLVSSEFDYPVHLDAPHYAELTGMYCVYKNRLHDGLDYVGFSHYDKAHRLIGSGGAVRLEELEKARIQTDIKQREGKGPTNITAMIQERVDSASPVHISLESHGYQKIFDQRILMDDRRPDAFAGEGVNCMDRILEDYNRFFSTGYTLFDVASDGFLNMCNCFVTPCRVFDKLMSFLCPIIESGELDIYDTQRRHRLQGGLLERYVALFFALEKIEKIDLSIVHIFLKTRKKKKKMTRETMNFTLEKMISKTFLYDYIVDSRNRKELIQWIDNFRPCPPPHLIKQSVVKEYAKRFSMHTLVETGTYLGFMVNATKDTFKCIYTVELDPALYRRAAKKFSKFNHITVMQGDSGEVLARILESVTEPCLFWLDAHHSSGAAFKTGKGAVETPIVSELRKVLSHPMAREHVILIDDAREFTGKNDYPTIPELKELVLEIQPDFVVELQDDIIRIHKKN